MDVDLRQRSEVATWLNRFADALQHGPERAAELFGTECYWRDLLSFTWNVTTAEGFPAIAAMMSATAERAGARDWRLDGEPSVDGETSLAWFRFDTAAGPGRGIVRLRQGRCWTLFTALDGLRGFAEQRGAARPLGTGHGVSRDAPTWAQVRADEQASLGTSRQPYCVIVGGGQGGLALAARLRRLDVPTIILDAHERPGDSWRNRYESLVLHDPVWYDHLPYLPFPDDWPVFCPKDKLADWLQSYARIMELNFWGSSRCAGASYDGNEWTVRVERAGHAITLHPKQLVLATGAYGFPRRPELPGAAAFGGTIQHSSEYRSGAQWRGRPAVVLGANTSAHDICADLWRQGAQVTMIQRSPTTVVRWQTLLELGFGPLYSEAALARGIDTATADLLFASMPYGAMPRGQAELYAEIARRDADFYARLAATGFLLDWGEDGSGLMLKALRRGAGYYIDVGASNLIISGEIAIRPGIAIASVRERSVVLTDGAELDAELIVLATGYGTMQDIASALVSPEVGARVGSCWGLGSGTKGDPGPWEGELRNLYKPTAQPGLWFHGGNLHLSRFYSQFLAWQIKARMERIEPVVYRND